MSEKHLDLQGSEIASAHAWLLALARGLVRDEARAEDLVQDAWVSLARRGLATVRDWRGFLGGVVRIRARRERVDARARTTREERSAPHEELPSADQLAARLELARAVVEELARLPAEQRVLLQLRYQEGLPARDRAPPRLRRHRCAAARARPRGRARAPRRRTHGRREPGATPHCRSLVSPSVDDRRAGGRIWMSSD
jgi:RNA polymerase sigma factor (sigma-70 family)